MKLGSNAFIVDAGNNKAREELIHLDELIEDAAN